MTEAQLKQFLHDFDTIQNKLLFQKNYHDTYSNSISKLSCNSDEFKIILITDVIKHLTAEEAFIIEIHLKDHHTWIETVELFSKRFGQKQERSERTLKRIQSRALNKMLEFINSLPDC